MSAVIHICYGNEADLPLIMPTGEAAFALDTKRFYLGTGYGRELINATDIGGGSTDLTFIHNQSIATDVWTITHGLNKFPAVTVVDSANNVVGGDVTYVHENQVIVQFSAVFAGKAYLN